MSEQQVIGRRGFLKGSALLAAAAGLAVAIPVQAQEPTPPPAEKKPEEPKKDEPAGKKPDEQKKALVDKSGREYRVCDMCGGNMYLEERRWTCDQCGFSYEV
jgi:anaerobic selenocysteine-containing dehydrogenase